ncbi:hypothetical protein KOW79_005439 [Hemibagrus wyckioides]|uniref:Uncharacterized protein n=1 Tax=Hemibagrus wyckioides TaxID=337641 RepID=A0A9D3P201_9TELE|nr:hypothetical protein KOW79_005439 [Hemibagrus wyckioides]
MEMFGSPRVAMATTSEDGGQLGKKKFCGRKRKFADRNNVRVCPRAVAYSGATEFHRNKSHRAQEEEEEDEEEEEEEKKARYSILSSLHTLNTGRLLNATSKLPFN